MLAACSSIPDAQHVIDAPPSRLFGADAAGSSIAVTIIRNRDFAGGGAPMLVTVDGTLRAKLYPTERAAFRVAPGHHQFAVRLGGLASVLGNDVPGVLELDVSDDLLLRAASTEGGVFIHRDMTEAAK